MGSCSVCGRYSAKLIRQHRIYGGAAQLAGLEVTAVTDGPLPGDDVTELISIS